MIVVADSSPLNYLVLIDEIHLLPALFGRVLIPQAVWLELQHPAASPKLRQWIAGPPDWLELRTVHSIPHPSLLKLDLGEREAIQLALEANVMTVLIDEAEGRQKAESLHLQVRGTLGILERAARLGMINFRQTLDRLERTNFRLSPTVRGAFLKRNS